MPKLDIFSTANLYSYVYVCLGVESHCRRRYRLHGQSELSFSFTVKTAAKPSKQAACKKVFEINFKYCWKDESGLHTHLRKKNVAGLWVYICSLKCMKR
jgi:hypothetical protein